MEISCRRWFVEDPELVSLYFTRLQRTTLFTRRRFRPFMSEALREDLIGRGMGSSFLVLSSISSPNDILRIH